MVIIIKPCPLYYCILPIIGLKWLSFSGYDFLASSEEHVLMLILVPHQLGFGK